MAHPAVVASRMARIAAPLRPLAPFEPTEEDLCRHAVSMFGHRLLAAPFNKGELPDSKGLSEGDADVAAEIFLGSHSLRAGYAIVRLADEAGRVWQLSPFDAFVLEWAALAVSLHDYDKLFMPSSPRLPENRMLRDWLSDPANSDAVKPCFQRDPVSYLLALSDRLQEFGRVIGPTDTKSLDADKVETFVRYPCSAVTLRVDRREQDEATITVELGPNEGTCFSAGDWDYGRIKDYKQREAGWSFGENGWLDGKGIFAKVEVEVVRSESRLARDGTTVVGPTSSRFQPVKLFYCFADADEPLREALERHLAALKWQGILSDWHHRKLGAEQGWRREADANLMSSDVVLLLISADFIASEYAYGVELRRALDMHRSGEARVIPILVRAVDVTSAPLHDLRSLPSDGRPVTSWSNQDEAWTDVVQGIRQVVEDIQQSRRNATVGK
jgi:hypothetical protein